MLELIGALLLGVVVGAVVMFFVARNNKDKFVEALGIDFEQKAKSLLNETDVDDKVKKFINDLRNKFKK